MVGFVGANAKTKILQKQKSLFVGVFLSPKRVAYRPHQPFDGIGGITFISSSACPPAAIAKSSASGTAATALTMVSQSPGKALRAGVALVQLGIIGRIEHALERNAVLHVPVPHQRPAMEHADFGQTGLLQACLPSWRGSRSANLRSLISKHE
jgi:hypothetical protein